MTDLQAQRKTKLLSKSLYSNTNCSLETPLTKIIDCKSLKHAGHVSYKEGALVVSDGDHQGATQADHQVRPGQAQDENVHGLQERRIPQHHGYDEAIVEHC